MLEIEGMTNHASLRFVGVPSSPHPLNVISNHAPAPVPSFQSPLSRLFLADAEQLPPRAAGAVLRSTARFLRDAFCLRTTQRTGWKLSFPFAMEGTGRLKLLQETRMRRLRPEASLPRLAASAMPVAVLAAASAVLARARR